MAKASTMIAPATVVGPGQLGSLLEVAIPARKPVLVTGAPGIGKSDIVAQAAAKVGASLIISHPVVDEPTDYKGLPWPGEGGKTAQFIPYGNLAAAMQVKDLTVWFFDDLGQATQAVQAALMQLFLAREINGQKIPENIVFVAATNRRTDRAGVSGLLEPVKSRFHTIVELQPDLQAFIRWWLAKGLSPDVTAFLRSRPELLWKFDPTNDLTNSPSPRTWAHVGGWLDAGLPPEVEFQVLAGAIGQGTATEFKTYLDMRRQLPTIDDIVMNPDGAKIPGTPAALYAVATFIGRFATDANFGRLWKYIDRMAKAGHGEYAAVAIKDAYERSPEITATPAWIQMASSELGALVCGTR